MSIRWKSAFQPSRSRRRSDATRHAEERSARLGRALAGCSPPRLLVLLLAAGAYAWRSGFAPRFIGASIADKLATAPRLSIVVLPFDNLSSDPEQDYFADGITDDLTTDLSHLADSFVIARNTAFTYKGKAVDAKAIGRELGVRYALEGSVRRVGETIDVNAQLISTETGAHVWADRFEGERAKPRPVAGGRRRAPRQFARRRARQGRSLARDARTAGQSRRGRPRDARTGSGVAFQPCRYKEAIDDFERALKLDPDLVRAKLGLSGDVCCEVIFGWQRGPARERASRGEACR